MKTYAALLVLTVLYACADEFYQLFREDRSGDIMVDSIRSLTGLIIISLLIQIKRRSKLKD